MYKQYRKPVFLYLSMERACSINENLHENNICEFRQTIKIIY